MQDLLALKAPENVWRPGSPRTRWGSLSAPLDPLAAKGGGVKGGEGKGKAGKGKWKGGEGGREGKGPTYFAVIRPLCVPDFTRI